MQTKTTLFGQLFHLSIIKQDNNYNLILSNTDENKKHVVPIDRYELKDVADFIYKYLENN